MDWKILLGIFTLIVGCYGAVIGSIYFTFTTYKELSNHLSSKADRIHAKVDAFSKEFNDFRADVSGALGEIVGQLKTINKGGGDVE